MATLLQTTQVKNRYVQGHLLGSGGVGAVYKAWDQRLKRTVAIKRMHKQSEATMETPDFIMSHELEILAATQHPRLLTLYDADEDVRGSFFVTEFIPGKSLMSLMKRQSLPEKLLIDIAMQTIEALHSLHKSGYVHGDLKPDNIMITQEANQNMVKLIDLGCSKKQGEKQKGDFFMGCCYYAPPELLRGKPFTTATDLYSLGHLFFHATAGVPAFTTGDLTAILKCHIERNAPSVREFRNDISNDFAGWIAKLIERNPADRFRDAEEARQALVVVAANHLEPGQMQKIQQKIFKTSAGAALASAALTGLVFWFLC